MTEKNKELFYTKLQIRYGGDIEDILLKTPREPTCEDLSRTIERQFRIPTDKQLIYFRGQRLHQYSERSYQRPLSKYSIYSGNLITLIGKRGLL